MTIDIKVELPDEPIGEPGENYSEWRSWLELWMDENGAASLCVETRHNSDNGVPFSVWHGSELTWRSGNGVGVVDADEVQRLAAKIQPLIERVHAGHSVDWDGSNFVGKLTEDAESASDDISRLMERAEWINEAIAYWDATEWVYPSWRETAEELGLRTDMTDAERNKAANDLDLMADGSTYLANTREAIDRMIELMGEEQDD